MLGIDDNIRLMQYRGHVSGSQQVPRVEESLWCITQPNRSVASSTPHVFCSAVKQPYGLRRASQGPL